MRSSQAPGHTEPPLSLLCAALQKNHAWLSPFASRGDQLMQLHSASVVDALNSMRTKGTTVTFVAQSELPTGEAYEAFIGRTSRVPTRENVHDLFNGLIWLEWPKTKHRMNRLQAHEIAVRGVSGVRGPLRDALTVFDENGAILQAPRELIHALRNREWHALFTKHREKWASARLSLLGHALLEKLLQPRKSITAHVLVVEELGDDSLATSLDPNELVSQSFLPLPVLGVPGWWSENEQADFYDDPAVFRPAR